VIEVTGGKPEEVYNPRISGGVSRMCADLTLAKELLNYEPKTDLKKGLELTVELDPQFNNGN